jgi:protein-S-isoprenylcysteine O-methyltransferase Ste14
MFPYFAKTVAAVVVWAGALFLAAGRADWLRAWIYIGVYLLTFAATAVIASRTNPEILVQRGTLRHPGIKRFDKIFFAALVPLALAAPVVAALDAVRFGWSPMPFWTVYPGIVLLLAGAVPVAWAMATNPFLENMVRIQTERGHKPITAGPYRFVRHPMYVGAILQSIAAPLLLGSVWAFVPVALTILAFVVRTALEDRTLRNELPGYAEYARRTRYRLLPRLW